MGKIALVWGKEGTGKNDGFGLAKLIAFHPEALDDLQGRLAKTRVVSRSRTGYIQLEGDGSRASVRLDWDGEAKNWLLTIFDTGAPRRTERTAYSLRDLWGDLPPSPRRDDSDVGDPGPDDNPPDTLSRRLDRRPPVSTAPGTSWVPPLTHTAPPPRPPTGKIMVAGREVPLDPEDRPTRRDDIRRTLVRIMGPRLYVGKVRGKGTLGFYRPKNGEVRLKKHDDIETLAHEFAHWMEFHSSAKARFAAMIRSGAGKAELPPLSYTDDPKLALSEGFAEFVRLWFTQHDEAAARAPQFLALFERTIDEAGIGRTMRKARDEAHKYYAQGPEAQQASKIGDAVPVREHIERALGSYPLDRLRQRTIDMWQGAKVVERTTRGDVQEARTSASKLFQLANGWESVYTAVLQDGTPEVDADGNFTLSGKGLNEILKPVTRGSRARFERFLRYMAARRASELFSQGRENLFTRAEIEAGLALADKDPAFKDVFREWTAFNKRMLRFYEQMSLITPDQRAAFEAANKDYVPFHRILEEVESGTGTPRAIGARLTGGQQNVRDIAVNIVEGLATNVRAAMLARAKSQMFRDVMRSDDGALFAAKIAPDSVPVQVAQQELARRIADAMAAEGLTIASNGMIVAQGRGTNAAATVDVANIQERIAANPELATFFMHGVKPTTAETYVDMAVIDGEQVWFEVREPLIADMLVNAHYRAPRGLGGAALSLAQLVRTIYTRTITSGLEFVGANLVRDTMSATLLSRSGFRPAIDTIRGMGHFVLNTKAMKEFRLHGAGYAGIIEGQVAEYRARRRLDLPPASAWDYLAQALAGWDRFTSAFEYGSRVGEFLRAKRAGASPTEAAFRAREISTDFAKRGNDQALTTFVRTVPFMNAAMQGLDRTARELLETKGKMTPAGILRFERQKMAFLAKGAVVVAFTAALWWLNHDEDWFKDLTDDERARFWWFRFPGMDAPGKVPKPFDLGHLFGTVPEAMLDWIAGRDGERAAGLLSFAAMQTFSVASYPAVLQPGIELMRNEDWRGAPIVPRGLESAPPEFQYTERTPLLYREFGRALGVAPVVAEHYARSWFGYYQGYVSDAVEAAFWRTDDWGERPFAKTPVIDHAAWQFTGRAVPLRTRWTEEYYELRERAEGVRQALTQARKMALKEPGAEEAIRQDPVLAALEQVGKTFAKIDRETGKLRAEISALKYDKSKTAAEKEAETDAIYAKINKRLKAEYLAAVETVRAAERVLAK